VKKNGATASGRGGRVNQNPPSIFHAGGHGRGWFGSGIGFAKFFPGEKKTSVPQSVKPGRGGGAKVRPRISHGLPPDAGSRTVTGPGKLGGHRASAGKGGGGGGRCVVTRSRRAVSGGRGKGAGQIPRLRAIRSEVNAVLTVRANFRRANNRGPSRPLAGSVGGNTPARNRLTGCQGWRRGKKLQHEGGLARRKKSFSRRRRRAVIRAPATPGRADEAEGFVEWTRNRACRRFCGLRRRGGFQRVVTTVQAGATRKGGRRLAGRGKPGGRRAPVAQG